MLSTRRPFTMSNNPADQPPPARNSAYSSIGPMMELLNARSKELSAAFDRGGEDGYRNLTRYLDQFHRDTIANPPRDHHVVRQVPYSVASPSGSSRDHQSNTLVPSNIGTSEDQQRSSPRPSDPGSEEDGELLVQQPPAAQPDNAMSSADMTPDSARSSSDAPSQPRSSFESDAAAWPGLRQASDQPSFPPAWTPPTAGSLYSNMVRRAPVDSTQQAVLQAPTAPRNFVRRPRREDPPPHPDRALVDRMKALKLCNNHFLNRDCVRGAQCSHDHTYKGGNLSEDESEALRSVARMAPCNNGTSCTRPNCIFGHRCPADPPSHRGALCAYGDRCKFSADMHY